MMCGKPVPVVTGAKQSIRWCSSDCRKRFNSNHFYVDARAHTLHASGKRCARCREVFPAKQLECNHIIPLRGKRVSPSCVHHLSNLEMVCNPCHMVIGIEQDIADGSRRGWRIGLMGEIVQSVADMEHGNTPLFTQTVVEFNERIYRVIYSN